MSILFKGISFAIIGYLMLVIALDRYHELSDYPDTIEYISSDGGWSFYETVTRRHHFEEMIWDFAAYKYTCEHSARLLRITSAPIGTKTHPRWTIKEGNATKNSKSCKSNKTASLEHIYWQPEPNSEHVVECTINDTDLCNKAVIRINPK